MSTLAIMVLTIIQGAVMILGMAVHNNVVYRVCSFFSLLCLSGMVVLLRAMY